MNDDELSASIRMGSEARNGRRAGRDLLILRCCCVVVPCRLLLGLLSVVLNLFFVAWFE